MPSLKDLISGAKDLANNAISAVPQLDSYKNAFIQAHRNSVIVEVRQIGQIASLFGNGICDALVNDWFRRIYAGKPTWRHHSRKEPTGDQKNIVYTADDVRWDKKYPRLQKLQDNNNAYKDDIYFRAVCPPDRRPSPRRYSNGW